MDKGRLKEGTPKTLGIKLSNAGASLTQYVKPFVPSIQSCFSGRPSTPLIIESTWAGKPARTETINPPSGGGRLLMGGKLNHTNSNSWHNVTDNDLLKMYNTISHNVITAHHKEKLWMSTVGSRAAQNGIYNSILPILTRRSPLTKRTDFKADMRLLANNTALQASNILCNHWKLEKSRCKIRKSQILAEIRRRISDCQAGSQLAVKLSNSNRNIRKNEIKEMRSRKRRLQNRKRKLGTNSAAENAEKQPTFTENMDISLESDRRQSSVGPSISVKQQDASLAPSLNCVNTPLIGFMLDLQPAVTGEACQSAEPLTMTLTPERNIYSQENQTYS